MRVSSSLLSLLVYWLALASRVSADHSSVRTLTDSSRIFFGSSFPGFSALAAAASASTLLACPLSFSLIGGTAAPWQAAPSHRPAFAHRGISFRSWRTPGERRDLIESPGGGLGVLISGR